MLRNRSFWKFFGALLVLGACAREEKVSKRSLSGISRDTHSENTTDDATEKKIEDKINEPTPEPSQGPSQTPEPLEPRPNHVYEPRGIGGGGAMSGFSISPYNKNLWFVGTDMGTLFRSVSKGSSWDPLDQSQIEFDASLPTASGVGFSSDGQTLFFARGGYPRVSAKLSRDKGITWVDMPGLKLGADEFVRYWWSNSENPNVMLCGTTDALYVTRDKGETWSKASGIPPGAALGSFIDYGSASIFTAVAEGIYRSVNGGISFNLYHGVQNRVLRAFAGGRDDKGLTLAYLDSDGTRACAWSSDAVTIANCGYVRLSRNKGTFFETTTMIGGQHLKMAENDSQTIYTTGHRKWEKQYGTKVWISRDAGLTNQLKLHQYNWDVNPFAPWPADKIEYSGIALDVGWDDAGYESFAINQKNSSEVGGSDWYFLHASLDFGDHWLAPFTDFADEGAPAKRKKWRSTGLEMTSVVRLRAHPTNTKLIYAGMADIGGIASDDSGDTWRSIRSTLNSIYDYAFDARSDQLVFAAMGSTHDFPIKNAQPLKDAGGIFKSTNRGIAWTRLTPTGGEWERQFLSVAYDYERNVIYAGSQGMGIGRSTDGGLSWQWFNPGINSTQKVIPQLEYDAGTKKVYALLTGDYPQFTNTAATGIYVLDPASSNPSWTLLKGTVHRHASIDSQYGLLKFPTSFAIDKSDPTRKTLWISDYENGGQWMATGIWKSTDGGANWYRQLQFTHPTSIAINPSNGNEVYIGGQYTLDGGWGQGGAYYTVDGGATWKKNDLVPLKKNLYAVMIDPANTARIIYGFFGGGMLVGPKPK